MGGDHGNADLTKAANGLPDRNRHSCGTPRPRNLTLSGRSPGSRVVAFITRLPGTDASDIGAIGSPLTVAGQLRFRTGFPLSFRLAAEDHDGRKLSTAKVKSSCHRGLYRATFAFAAEILGLGRAELKAVQAVLGSTSRRHGHRDDLERHRAIGGNRLHMLPFAELPRRSRREHERTICLVRPDGAAEPQCQPAA